jgi:multiple sugar transport system substrate-binding protein
MDLARTAQLTRRRLLTGVTAATAAGALTPACAPGPAGQPSNPNASLAPARLTLGHRAIAAYLPVIEQALPVFKQQHPHIQVDVDAAPSANWTEKFTASWSAGSGPDVFEAWDQWFWQFAAKGVAANVNDLARTLPKRELDDFHPWQWAGMQIPQTSFRFGLPKYVNIQQVYVNLEAMERAGQKLPPQTWSHDDYADFLRRLTRRGGDPAVVGGYVPIANLTRYQPHLWAFGGNLVDPADYRKVAFHQPQAMAGWEWIWNRMFQDRTMLSNADLREMGLEAATVVDGFAQGRIATIEDGLHRLQEFAEKVSTRWELVHIPRGPARRATWGTTDGWGLWKGSQGRAAAWELVRFLAGPDYTRLQTRGILYIPSRASLLDDWTQTVRQRYPALEKVNLKVVQETITGSQAYAKVAEVFPCFQEGNAALSPTISAVFGQGTEKPATLRDVRDQVERAATGCGVTFQ